MHFLSYKICLLIYPYLSIKIKFLKKFQYVVIPTRRSTAEAFQILISHMFGDAGSPYLVGIVSISLYFFNV